MHSASCQERPLVDTQLGLSIGLVQRSPGIFLWSDPSTDSIGRLDGRQVVFPGFFAPFAEDLLVCLGCGGEDFIFRHFISRFFGGKTCWLVVFPRNTLHHLVCLLDVVVGPPRNHIWISLVPVLVDLVAVVRRLVVVVCLLKLGLALHGELAFG